MSDVKQTVKDMAKLAVFSGRISEVHEKNMKMYPLIFFNGVREVRIEYDLSTRSNVDETDAKRLIVNAPTTNASVSYFLTIDRDAINDNMEKRRLALEMSIKNLFWSGVRVAVHVNDVLLSGESGEK